MNQNRPSTSLRTQILLPSILALLVFATIMGWALIMTTHKTFNTKFLQTGQSLVENVAPTMSFALATGDRDYLKARLKSAFRQDELRHIEVINSQGNLSVALSRQDDGSIVEVSTKNDKKILFPHETNHEPFHADVPADPIEVEFLTAPSPHDEIPLGTLRAILDRSAIIEERNQEIAYGVLLALITALVMCIIVAGLARRIVEPLKDLTSTLERLEAGDFSARAGNSPIDEVGRVQNGVNAMALSLDNAQRDLKQKVEQATAKLVKTVDDLERSESKYRSLVDSASDGVFSMNSNLRLLQVNPAIEQLTGRDHGDLIGEDLLNLVLAEQQSRIKQVYARQTEEHTACTYEVTLVSAIGERVVVEISSRPHITDNICVGFHGVARDITARRRIDQARAEAQELAESANHAKSMFLATVSHEIRSPMNGILGFLDLLNKTNLDDVQNEYITTAEKSARTLLRIIDDLLDMARVESGYLDFRPEAVDLREFTEHVMAEAEQQVDAESLTLKTELDDALPEIVVTDPARLNQILTNILGNACKFTGDGTVTLAVDCLDRANTSATVVFSIRDSGPGFDEDDIEEILKPFGRGPEAIKNRVAGVGLGLAIAKTLVDEMAGRIDISNLPRGGGEVKITVSLLTSSKRALPKEKMPSAITVDSETGDLPTEAITKTPRVLVVDDSEINTRFVSTLLSYHGIEAVQANSGAGALELCETGTFDLIFTDLHMPSMDGVEMANRIRATLADRCPPMIALTADATARNSERLEHEDFDQVLFKPITETELLNAITRWVGYSPTRHAPETKSVVSRTDAADDILGKQRGLEFAGGNEALWESNVVLFIEDLKRILPLFDTTHPDFHPDRLVEHTHRISGSAAYIGARKLEQLAMNVETECLDPDSNRVEKLCMEFDSAAQDFLSEARNAGFSADEDAESDKPVSLGVSSSG